MDPREDLEALMAVRVQGVASPDRLALALGSSIASARERAAGLTRAGLAVERTGRMSGLSLTPDGKDALERALEAEGMRDDESLCEAYDRFEQLNGRFLAVASEWQVRRHGGVEQPNDHSDPDYDHAVIERLAELHDGAVVCLRRIARSAPRFAAYRGRLDRCVDRLRHGEREAFTAVLKESYHTVWFELHQDLLLTLGRQREA